MKTETFLKRPRYLRAIPSLMMLTTAMAWGMSPDMTDSETGSKRARVVVSSQVDLSQGSSFDNAIATGLARQGYYTSKSLKR